MVQHHCKQMQRVCMLLHACCCTQACALGARLCCWARKQVVRLRMHIHQGVQQRRAAAAVCICRRQPNSGALPLTQSGYLLL